MRIALAGNPNSGKTTLFNAITGKIESVGNWPGVTVEKKEANIKKKYLFGEEYMRIVDLPGAYSISPYSGEEAITSDFIQQEQLDVIINIIDGSSLERSLFFTTQLLEFNIPVVVALNKNDLMRRHNIEIDLNKLSQLLQCPVIETVAKDGIGLKQLMQTVQQQGHKLEQPAQIIKDQDVKQQDIKRQQYVKDIVQKSFIKRKDTSKITLSDKIDRFVANPILGLVIFFGVLYVVYSIAMTGPGLAGTDFLNEVFFGEWVPDAANSLFESLNVAPLLQAVIVEGAIGGVGAVLGFLPQIMVLFFLLTLLEDSGYMARVAIVMDRYFKRIGLSGKSIIPMIVGTGCSIPGVMAARTIEDDNERRMTTMLAPFVPCGAKLPVIALFSLVFFPGQAWVAPSIYILAIAVIVFGGIILKKIFVWDSESTFIMELPEYKLPSITHALKQMFSQAWAFIRKATTIVLVMNALIWFMQAYGWDMMPVEEQGNSILASVGGVISPILIPLGIVGWQMAAAALTGFVAKENVVSTFAVILLGAANAEAGEAAIGVELVNYFTPITAYAFLAFNLFTPPCFAAIGAMNAELGSRKWLWRTILFQLSIGYFMGIVIAQIGTLLLEGRLATGFVPGIIIIGLFIALFIFRVKSVNKKNNPLGDSIA